MLRSDCPQAVDAAKAVSTTTNLRVILVLIAVVLFAALLIIYFVLFRIPNLHQNDSLHPPNRGPYANESPARASISGIVTSVSDGDTFTMLDEQRRQHTIRLSGVDAPELSQDYGKLAKQELALLVHGKTVDLLGNKNDRYGRRIAKVVVDDTDVGLQQVINGLAWHYKKFQYEQTMVDREAYAAAEWAARKGRVGLWTMPDPTPPWDFRSGASADPQLENKLVGNKKNLIYHWKGCQGYAKVSPKNRVLFDHWEDAEFQGFQAAKNCSKPRPE